MALYRADRKREDYLDHCGTLIVESTAKRWRLHSQIGSNQRCYLQNKNRTDWEYNFILIKITEDDLEALKFMEEL